MEKFKEKKNIRLLFIAFIILICLGWTLLLWNDLHLSRLNLDDYKIYLTGEDGYLMNIDSASCKGDGTTITKDYITMSGWVINKNVSFDRVTIDIVLRNITTGEVFKVPTTMWQRTDVTDSEGDGKNQYDWSGFNVKLPYSRKINTEKYDYQILALLKVNDEDAVIVNSGRITGEFK